MTLLDVRDLTRRASSRTATKVFAEVALSEEFTEFLTLPAYERLVANGREAS